MGRARRQQTEQPAACAGGRAAEEGGRQARVLGVVGRRWGEPWGPAQRRAALGSQQGRSGDGVSSRAGLPWQSRVEEKPIQVAVRGGLNSDPMV